MEENVTNFIKWIDDAKIKHYVVNGGDMYRCWSYSDLQKWFDKNIWKKIYSAS